MALSQRLSTEQSEHRLPSLVADAVGDGVLVWSDALACVFERFVIVWPPELAG